MLKSQFTKLILKKKKQNVWEERWARLTHLRCKWVKGPRYLNILPVLHHPSLLMMWLQGPELKFEQVDLIDKRCLRQWHTLSPWESWLASTHGQKLWSPFSLMGSYGFYPAEYPKGEAAIDGQLKISWFLCISCTSFLFSVF